MSEIKYVCTNRLRDFNKKILLYRLYGSDQKFVNIDPDTLKSYIDRGDITVENLYLTSDYRLKEKSCTIYPKGIQDKVWIKGKSNEKRAGIFCKSLDTYLMYNSKTVEERTRLIEQIVSENVELIKKSRGVVIKHRENGESDESIINMIVSTSGSELLAYMSVYDTIYSKLGIFVTNK
jgi:hypothetical protein